MTVAVMEFCTPPVPGEKHKYYGDVHNNFIKLPRLVPPGKSAVTPPAVTRALATKSSRAIAIEQQKTLHSVASSGNLLILKQILLRLPDPLKAVNDPHPATGLTPIHFAASRGHVDIVRCLVEEYQVSVDSRDKEGETPLLKASYAGHYHVVQYLLSKKANIHQKDKDGWTALHNACSRGFLPIARLLVERGARVDAQNKTGHTPLINAASKGYMSIVEYLLEEAHANPLIKNSFGEAAYDVSAASGEAGEAYICEMLEKAGSKWWHMQHAEGIDLSPYSHGTTYDLLEFHITVMVILHENQRSTSILGLSRPQFSANALTRHDVRGPWSLHPSGIPSSKEQVKLPPGNNERGTSNWFWLTDWQIDYSDPRVDPTSGWQYAKSFEDSDDAWTPVAPTAGSGWVRRRRWVRVMKRRMDLAKGNHRGNDDPVDSPTEPQTTDYVYQAEDLVQNVVEDEADNSRNSDPTARELRNLTRELRRYEEAVQTLLAGIKTDYNQYRKHQANVLVTSYSEHIEKLNAKISSIAASVSTPVGPTQQNAELARELGLFVESNSNRASENATEPVSGIVADLDANPWSRDSAAVVQQQSTTWNESSSLDHVDLIGHGSSPVAAEDTEQLDVTAALAEGPRQFAWESDVDAKECRRCARKFKLLVRRHHCRRCGLIVCDRCSSARTYLPPDEILQDPRAPRESLQILASQHQRVCDKCYADLGLRT